MGSDYQPCLGERAFVQRLDKIPNTSACLKNREESVKSKKPKCLLLFNSICPLQSTSHQEQSKTSIQKKSELARANNLFKKKRLILR